MVEVQEVFDFMKKVFKKDLAAGFKRKIVIQYNIGKSNPEKYQVSLENSELKFSNGTPEKASAEVTFDSIDSFYKVTIGELEGMKAFLTGKIRISGPQALLQEWNKLFPPK